MSNEKTKIKASERLSSIETSLLKIDQNTRNIAKRVGELEMINFNMSRENDILKEALQLLNDKQIAVINLSNEGKPLSDENIENKISLLKEQALKEKIEAEVSSGNITQADVVSENSVIVARELTKEGKVENPRLQFLVGRLVEDLKTKFLSKKAGELIEGEGDKLDIEILEVYDFVQKEIKPQETAQS